MIRFACPGCNTFLKTSDQDGGSKIPCPKCGKQMWVPIPPSTRESADDDEPEARVAPAPRSRRRYDDEDDYDEDRGRRPARRYEERDDEEDEDYRDYRRSRPRRGRRDREAESPAALVCSILSLVFGCVAFLFCPPLFGPAGLVLGIIGTTLARNKVLGIFGIIVSVLGTVCGMIIGAMVATMF